MNEQELIIENNNLKKKKNELKEKNNELIVMLNNVLKQRHEFNNNIYPKKACYKCLKIELDTNDYGYTCEYCKRYLCDECNAGDDDKMPNIDIIACCNVYSCINKHIKEHVNPDYLNKPNYVMCDGCGYYMCQKHFYNYRCDWCKKECTGCGLIMFGNDDGTNISIKCLLKQILLDNNPKYRLDQYMVDIIHQYYDKYYCI